MITRPHGRWKRDPEKIHITPGSVAITSGVWPDAVTSIEPVYYGRRKLVLRVDVHLSSAWRAEASDAVLAQGTDRTPGRSARLGRPAPLVRAGGHPAMHADDRHLDRAVLGRPHLRSRHGAGTPPSVHIPVVEDFADRLAKKMGSREGALVTEVINRTATAHFTGGIPIGDSSKSGAVDPYQRVFGQPGLHVMDGSVMPANPGVNPSLTITALAERAMSLWPNKGERGHQAALGLRL